MSTDELIPRQWYWVRRSDGSLAPYVFHRMGKDEKTGLRVAQVMLAES